MEQGDGDTGAENGEPRHDTPAPCGALGRGDRQGDEHGEEHERDQQVAPHGHPSNSTGQVALEAPPHECLHDLVRTEDQRKTGQSKGAGTAVHVTHGIDPEHPDDRATDEIGLRREAHAADANGRSGPAAAWLHPMTVVACAGGP